LESLEREPRVSEMRMVKKQQSVRKIKSQIPYENVFVEDVYKFCIVNGNNS
jgi:hypothetical protein